MLKEPLQLHCIGGFVVCYFYGLPRVTGDIDILSKLERNTSKDRDDADYLFRTQKLGSQALRERYQQELRPYLAKENWHDKTSELPLM